MTRAVLVTTDFSDLAAVAFPHAVRLARQLDAPLRIVHVVDTWAHFTPKALPDLDAWGHQVKDLFHARLEAVAAELREEGVKVETACMAGHVVPSLKSAMADDVELAVVASHGRGGFRRHFVGSVASAVLLNASVPVLVVREDMEERDFRRMLFATDLSDVATGALAECGELAERLELTVEVFHADVPPTIVTLARYEAFTLPEPWPLAEMDSAIDGTLGSMARDLSARGLRVSTRRVPAERAADAICTRADRGDIDLVAVAPHWRTGLGRAVLGSVADEVVRRSMRPVLVIPPLRV